MLVKIFLSKHLVAMFGLVDAQLHGHEVTMENIVKLQDSKVKRIRSYHGCLLRFSVRFQSISFIVYDHNKNKQNDKNTYQEARLFCRFYNITRKTYTFCHFLTRISYF